MTTSLKNSSSRPLISVIVPTFNRSHVVGRAINSVLEQTYDRIELIVVDDGSTDDTASLLSGYGNAIKVLKQTNSGPTVARNRGVNLARGDLIAFLDSDDYWLPTKLAKQVALMDRVGETAICCLCNCTIVYPNGMRCSSFSAAGMQPTLSEGVWLNPDEILTTRFVLFNQAVLVRRDVLERIGCFDEQLRFAEDYDFPLRLALEGKWVLSSEELPGCNAAGPDSWGERALREEQRLAADLLAMRRKLLCLVRERRAGTRVEYLSRVELRRAENYLRATNYIRSGNLLLSVLGRVSNGVSRIERAVFRRSATYPQLRLGRL
jgi:glycosyltransferase involved in cell wall biosynthesis